ncbi:MAG: phosphopantothenoylcysteine decarboxylase [Chthoniobacteraceae bacterium]
MPRVIITCGPSYEPIDEVRRITNSSSGELGVRLANRLTASGFEVVCLLGKMAIFRGACDAARMIPFSTNEDLQAKLEALAREGGADAVLHAAALADFKVQREGGERKIASRGGIVKLMLVPATKLIARLRPLFPRARLVGWKYELDGTREDALAAGRAQIETFRTDACAVNGAAYGEGFGVLARDGTLTHVPDKGALCEWLAEWLSRDAAQ